jgi:hypothetical protein
MLLSTKIPKVSHACYSWHLSLSNTLISGHAAPILTSCCAYCWPWSVECDSHLLGGRVVVEDAGLLWDRFAASVRAPRTRGSWHILIRYWGKGGHVERVKIDLKYFTNCRQGIERLICRLLGRIALPLLPSSRLNYTRAKTSASRAGMFPCIIDQLQHHSSEIAIPCLLSSTALPSVLRWPRELRSHANDLSSISQWCRSLDRANARHFRDWLRAAACVPRSVAALQTSGALSLKGQKQWCDDNADSRLL